MDEPPNVIIVGLQSKLDIGLIASSIGKLDFLKILIQNKMKLNSLDKETERHTFLAHAA